jgi:peptidoglycan/xylan/chitin deacetylase (PgdA/CDA1 family)
MKTLCFCAAILVVCLALAPSHVYPDSLGPGRSDGAIGEGFDVEIRANPEYGIVPFEVTFRVQITEGVDTVEEVYWDFESDGTIDAAGPTSSHTYTEAIDYTVKADIVTANNGTLIRTISISGYSALMTLNFDDGHESVYEVALPLLESKGLVATAYVVPTWIGQMWYMEWSGVQALQDAGWDIGSHSLTHPVLPDVDDSTLNYELNQSRIELQSRGLAAVHFGLPYNAHDQRVIDAVKLYYESARIGDGLNPRVEQADLYELFSYVSLSWRAFSFYRAHIDSAIAVGGWYILNNHIVVNNCFDSVWCIDTQMLEDVIDYALQNRVKIVSLGEALERGLDNTAGVAFDVPEDAPRAMSIDFVGGHLGAGQPVVDIDYSTSVPAHIDIGVYDTRGRRVCTLVDAFQAAGKHSVSWTGMNRYGTPVASGVYFCAFEAGETFGGSRRVVVVR